MHHCEYCCFFEIVTVKGPNPGDRLIGHCHRFPPPSGQRSPRKSDPGPVVLSPFPLVRASDWCGEFRQATAPLRRMVLPNLEKSPQPDWRLLVSAREAAKMLSVSQRHLWQMSAKGELPRVMVGARVCYSIESLRAWIAAHEAQGSG